MPGNHPKDSHKGGIQSNNHAFPLYWRGQDHAARQFWHARLDPFARSERSRATQPRLPCLPRPALSLRGWRPGAGRTPAAHTRGCSRLQRSPTDWRGATGTKDGGLAAGGRRQLTPILLRGSGRLGNAPSSRIHPGGPFWLYSQAHNY